MKSEIKDFINRNEDCKIKECPLCGNHCRDCRHLEMDNDYYNDGTRRCDYKGTWVRPSDPACGNFAF